MLIFDIKSSSAEETESAGEALASALLKDGNTNSFIALYGDLGAGKTAFVRGLARVVTPGVNVFSPTYTVVNEYHGKEHTLCHFDMFRITSEEDLYSIGFYDYDNCMMAVEWSENIGFVLPDSYIRVNIVKTGDNSRDIKAEIIKSE